MGGRARSRGRRRIGIAASATILATALAAFPPAVRPAVAANPLRVQADAVYTLDPDAASVHVAIDFRVTNLKPSSAQYVYYYRDIAFALQSQARSIRGSDHGGSLSVTTRKHEFYVLATVHLRANLYYQGSASFTVQYDLVGAAPRSESPIRVGKAFATFGVWAWGDNGRGTVEVRTPPGFANEIDGDPMQVLPVVSGETLYAKPAEPDQFYAIISSDNRAAYGATRISFDGGVEIVVQAWPEDAAWDTAVSATLRKGLPKLRELIGLPWPVEHDLNVRERYTPALEGYAGVFFTDSQRIDVSEDLDPVVIVHEASHAWFNESLFDPRWIYEGLAQEYAYQVQRAVGGEDGGRASAPSRTDPGFVVLSSWSFPRVIRDQQTDDRERYGYQASFYVVHRLVLTAGLEQMRAAFAAADGDLTAYPGAGIPEKVAEKDGWKRLLDLIEPIDKPDPKDIERTLRDYVLSSSVATELGNRTAARTAYRELLDVGDGWLAPWFVRKPLGEWRFGTAETRMAAATAVLGLRDKVATAAADLGLEPDDALKAAYENAEDGFDAATKLANDELGTLTALADARAKVDATPDLLTQLGLLDQAPRVPYEAGRKAFESGDLEEAVRSAAAATAIIAGAPAIGEQRLLTVVAAVVISHVLLILLVLLLIRRSRRRRRIALAAGGAAATLALGATPGALDSASIGVEATPFAVEAPTEPYATLAADPAPAPLPPSARPPDIEGGPARGEPSPDS